MPRGSHSAFHRLTQEPDDCTKTRFLDKKGLFSLTMGYFIKRILLLVIMAFTGTALIFVSMRVLPGDPVIVVLGDAYTEETYAAITTRLGFDQPLHVQFVDYLSRLLRGDLGHTLFTNVPIAQILGRALPYSLELAAGILAIGFLAGGAMGMISALAQRRFLSESVRLIYMLGISVPPFLLCILFILLFSLTLGWFPMHGTGELPGERLYHLVLPALAGAAPLAAIVAGVLRAHLLQILQSDYIRTARAKGLSEMAVVFVHALKNALIPMITVMGNAIPVLLAELVLIERIFNRPGIGKMLLDSMLTRDYPAVQSTMVVIILAVLVVNLLVDLAYTAVDPRVKYE